MAPPAQREWADMLVGVNPVGEVEVEGMDTACMDVKADVGEAEGRVGAISTSNAVLTGSEEEKEGNEEEVKLALPFAFGAVMM
eukprot:2946325-Ditylum_brightwellii.AAC.1